MIPLSILISISIFLKDFLSISIAISIFSELPYRYRFRYQYFPELPYRYRYRYFQNDHIDIDIDIFQMCRYIDNRYSILIYQTGLLRIHTLGFLTPTGALTFIWCLCKLVITVTLDSCCSINPMQSSSCNSNHAALLKILQLQTTCQRVPRHRFVNINRRQSNLRS